EIRTSWPERISGQPSDCGSVGWEKRRENHSATRGSKLTGMGYIYFRMWAECCAANGQPIPGIGHSGTYTDPWEYGYHERIHYGSRIACTRRSYVQFSSRRPVRP